MTPIEARQRAIAIAESCCATTMDYEVTTEMLGRLGLSPIDAQIGIDVVVAAFGWETLRLMGVTQFADDVRIQQDGVQDTIVKASDSALFIAALELAKHLFTNGYTGTISKKGVTAMVGRSAEAKAASKALANDPSRNLSEGVIRTSFSGYDLAAFRRAAGYPPLAE